MPRKSDGKPRKTGRPKVKIPAALKRRFLKGESPRVLAREFGISERVIFYRALEENWKGEEAPAGFRTIPCSDCPTVECLPGRRRFPLVVDGKRHAVVGWANCCPKCGKFYAWGRDVQRLTAEIRAKAKTS